MTRKTTTAILIGLVLVAISSTARANIASKAYVDDQDNTLIFGTTSPSASDKTALNTAGGVIGVLATKANNPSGTSVVLKTDISGEVINGKVTNDVIAEGAVTNSKICQLHRLSAHKTHAH